MSYAVVIRPSWDATTYDLFKWAAHIIAALQSSHRTIDDVASGNVRRLIVERALSATEHLVVFYGHGGRDHLEGHKHHRTVEVVVDQTNSHLLRDKIVVVVACDSMHTLGPMSVTESGARAYIGYDQLFGFSAYDDIVLADFMRCANSTTLALIHGRTVKEACDTAKHNYEYTLQYYESDPGRRHAEAFAIASYLYYNMKNLKFSGDPEASLPT